MIRVCPTASRAMTAVCCRRSEMVSVLKKRLSARLKIRIVSARMMLGSEPGARAARAVLDAAEWMR
jgi:hypothetical protein